MKKYQGITLTLLILISQTLGQNVPSKAEILEATRLKDRLESEHAKDPKDAMSLAVEVLERAFAKSTNNANSISAMEIMSRLSSASGSGHSRFYTVRMLELMDANHDGKISNQEYVSMYAEPSASVAKSLELMHKLCDYNGDGVITKWEQLMVLITGNSDKTPMPDLWKIAVHKHSEMDSDNNGLVTREEFMTFQVYQVQKNIYEQNKEYVSQSNL